MLYKIFFPLLISIIFCIDSKIDNETFQEFIEYTKKYNKKYNSSEEFEKRYNIYKNNLQEIKRFAIKTNNNLKFGINKFADLTKEEFANNYLNFDPEIYRDLATVNPDDLDLDEVDAPDNWDWTEQGIITTVKHQLLCGACWSFATSAAIESQFMLEYGLNISLSEQQLIDCDYSNKGCSGGNMKKAFNYLKTNGLMSANDYPFIGDSGECQYDESKTIVKVKNWAFVPKDEEIMKKALYKYGPLAGALNGWMMEFYENGIFEPYFDFLCPASINHAVVIVGYGIEEKTGMLYWKVKNSWGQDWGDNGYFKVRRGGGICGIDQYTLVVEVEKIN